MPLTTLNETKSLPAVVHMHLKPAIIYFAILSPSIPLFYLRTFHKQQWRQASECWRVEWKRETKNWRCKSANVMCRMLVASKICTSWTGKRSLLTWMNKKSSASILTRQWNSMFLFPPLIWEHYMGINILFFCVSLPAWSFSLFILSKPLMKFWNAMLGWRVDVPAASWVSPNFVVCKGVSVFNQPMRFWPGYTWY